jgi:hypothetical protein
MFYESSRSKVSARQACGAGWQKEGTSVFVDFGVVYFLDRRLEEIGYLDVLKKVCCFNFDALLFTDKFYCLDSEATLRDVAWYKQSYASCLFQRANLHDQRIAETLRKMEVRRVSISLFPLTSGTFLTMQMEI